MKIVLISENACKIWDILNNSYIEKVCHIKSKLNIEENDFYIALGWLAHEKRIYLIDNANELYISNKQSSLFFRL